MKIKYPVPRSLVPVIADEDPLLHFCLDIGGSIITDLPLVHVSKELCLFASRSYNRTSALGLIVFYANVNFPSK